MKNHSHSAIESADTPTTRRYWLIQHLQQTHDVDDANGVHDLEALHADVHAEDEVPAARLGQAQQAKRRLIEALDRLQQVDPYTHDRLTTACIDVLKDRLRP